MLTTCFEKYLLKFKRKHITVRFFVMRVWSAVTEAINPPSHFKNNLLIKTAPNMARHSLELEELRQLLREEQELRERAELREQEGQRGLRQTTLIEYLDLCHEHLSKSISIQTVKSQSTQGDPSNAKAKIRPDYLHSWEDFLETQGNFRAALFPLSTR